jgi:hypothetical protein
LRCEDARYRYFAIGKIDWRRPVHKTILNVEGDEKNNNNSSGSNHFAPPEVL